MNKKELSRSFISILGAAAYILAVSQLMQNGDRVFGSSNSIFIPFAILLLFCFSAAVVGGLVLGRSVWLFFDGKKQESLESAVYSVGWLGVITVLTFVIMLTVK